MSYEDALAFFKGELKEGKCSDYCLQCNSMEMAINALEKLIPKKPIKKNPICYEKTKDGTEFIAYDYFCPDCNKQIKATVHHCHCGQALDWSDTE
jgi:hypothetical protein